MEGKEGKEGDAVRAPGSEGKELADDKFEHADGKAPEISLLECEVGPNNCAVSAELELYLRFRCDRAAAQAFWRVEYIVDSAYARHIIELGRTEAAGLEEGVNEMYFHAKEVCVDGVEPGRLTNAGILAATLVCGGADAATVNMVVQVAARGGALERVIYSPLE